MTTTTPARAIPEQRRFALIAMGRAIVDVYGEQTGCRLEEVTSFAKYVGGCPANVAIGAARLGLRVALITRVGDEQHGRFIREQLVREGVDVSSVVTDPKRATGVAFLGIRDKETFPLLHYREDPADMAIAPTDYSREFIASATALLVSGSHLTTSSAAQNIAHAISLARESNTRVVFDIDYRPLFWGLARREAGESRFVESSEVTRASQRFLGESDLVVGTEEEIRIAGGRSETVEALRAIRDRTSALIVMKRGSQGCMVFESAIPRKLEDDSVIPGFPVDVFNVVGAGDGFLAGFLYGWLRSEPTSECGRLGNACGALVVSRHGCSPASPTIRELRWFLEQGSTKHDLYRNDQLARLHRATTRAGRPTPVLMLECDELPGIEQGLIRDERTISGFKSLVAKFVLDMLSAGQRIGVSLDSDAGEDALLSLGASPDWVVRRIDVPRKHTLTFVDGKTAGVILRSWPTHHMVKCRVSGTATGEEHPLQTERLRELYIACQHYGHECLFDLACEPTIDRTRVLEVVRDLHRMGIVPDWWVVPAGDEQWFAALGDLVSRTQEECRGILVRWSSKLGWPVHSAAAADNALHIQGVVMDSKDLSETAKKWLKGHVDDSSLLDELGAKVALLATARSSPVASHASWTQLPDLDR